MKFAANGTLYRGSKPVMWSVVEKTALAEAEVEYEDYTSDTVWVKFPCVVRSATSRDGNRQLEYRRRLRSSSGRRRLGLFRATGRSAIRRESNMVSTKLPTRLPTTGPNPATCSFLADKLSLDVFRQARVTAFKKISSIHMNDLATFVCQHPLKKFEAVTISRYRCWPAIMLPRIPVPDLSIPRRAMAAKISTSGPRTCTSQLAGARHQHDNSLYRRCRWPLHRAGARFYRQARAHRQRRKGRRQRGGDQSSDRRRHADRARPAQASVSAFVALKEAGNLPQYAAMVHRHGSADRAVERHRPAWRNAASACRAGHQGNALGAGAGREADLRHDREPPRLGDLAPARLGCADRRFHQGERRTARWNFSTIPR